MSKIATMVTVVGAACFVNGNTYVPDLNGLISQYTTPAGAVVAGIADADIEDLLISGCWFGGRKASRINFGAVAAASATVTVASGALSNGAKTIAAQPDVPRPLQMIVAPGTLAITAGTVAFVYTDENGNSQTDTFSIVTALSTSVTKTTSHGVAALTSVTVAGLVGGAAAKSIEVGTTADIALPINVRPDGVFGQGLSVTATVDGVADTAPTLNVSATDPCIITPHTAPDGTKVLSFGFSYVG